MMEHVSILVVLGEEGRLHDLDTGSNPITQISVSVTSATDERLMNNWLINMYRLLRFYWG